MLRKIEEIRSLRDSVLMKESCARKKTVENKEKKRSLSGFRGTGKTKTEKSVSSKVEEKIRFKRWMRDVVFALGEQMDLDVMPEALVDVPWKTWFDKGIDPLDAVGRVMEEVENEDEDKDGDSMVDLDALAEALQVSRRKSVVLDERDGPESEDDKGNENEDDNDFEEEDGVEDDEDSDVGDGNETKDVRVDESMHSFWPVKQEERDEEARLIEVAASTSRAIDAQLKKPADDQVDEARVMGGDWGRWSAATKAAGEKGGMLAKAIEKATDEKYKFAHDGKASSASGGSELWFAIEPEKSDKDSFYLGFKIHGEEEDVSWDVMLRKGKGLGSAKGVATEKSVNASGLQAAIGKVAGMVGKRE